MGDHRDIVRDQRVASGESDQAVHQDRPALLQADEKLQLNVIHSFRPGGRVSHKVRTTFQPFLGLFPVWKIEGFFLLRVFLISPS